jgi:iron complex outermembrane receptor protein
MLVIKNAAPFIHLSPNFMIKTYLFILCLALFSAGVRAQALVGNITDSKTGQAIPGVTVSALGTNQGVASDVQGNYRLPLAAGTYRIQFSFVGYQTQVQNVSVSSGDQTLNIALAVSVQTLNDVVVVGSRSTQIRSRVETPAPVDIITARELQSTGQIEPTQMINLIAPSFNSARQTVADGSDHIDPATLRGLGPDQVLVLLNGKRRHNQALTNVNGTVGRGSVGTDLNTLPTAGIERIEVLRDGASSQYGSDAIAGVVNVVLKRDTGTAVNVHYGQQYEGDGRNVLVGLYHGLKVGKLSVSAAADLRFREATNRAGRYTGPVYVDWNVAQRTNPSNPETRDQWLTRRQERYEQDKALIAQNNFSLDNNLLVGNAAVNNYAGMINGNLAFSKAVNLYFSTVVNYRRGLAAGFYRYPFQAQTGQVIIDLYPNGFLPQIQSTIWDRSFIVGLNGEFGNGWRWDFSNVYGGNSFRYDVKNSNNASQFSLGVNAPTEFYAGTLQFNQNTTDLNLAKDFGTELGLKSFNVAAGLTYRLDNYQIQAGEEASYANYDPSETNKRAGGAQVFPGFQPSNAINAFRNVFGAYVDLESDLTERWLVNLAGRFENYSDFGSNFAGKFSTRYKFAESFSLRGSISNGFRAPSIHQRYFSAISTVFVSVANQGLVPRQQGTFRNDSPVAQAFGIPSLTAEKSTNYSLGVTSQPLSNLTITIDAYQIDIKDRIVLTGAFQRNSAAVAQILDNAGQTDVQSAVFFTNAVDTRTQGLDVVIAHNQPIGAGTLTLTLAGNVNKTTVQGTPKNSTTLPPDAVGNILFNRQERARLELAQPRSKFSLAANYRLGKFGAYARVTRYGEVTTYDPNTSAPAYDAATGRSVLDEYFSPKAVTDLSFSYKVNRVLQVTVGANNLFDVYPDKLKQIQYPTPGDPTNIDNSSFGRFVYSRNATQFGFNGGYYFASLSANF